MILGLLSDTHGAQATTAAALAVLRQAGAEAFVHCGDVGTPDVLDELAGARAWVVLGNTDDAGGVLLEHGRALGFTMAPAGPLRIELAGRVLVAFHGHEQAFSRLSRSLREEGVPPPELGPCDYVLHGHSHFPHYERFGPLGIINPGALHRASKHTVATLDLSTNNVQFCRVPGAERPSWDV